MLPTQILRLAPASASFSTAMICSSLNRFDFIVRSHVGRTLLPRRTIRGGHLTATRAMDVVDVVSGVDTLASILSVFC